jgi:monoamine oxidase
LKEPAHRFLSSFHRHPSSKASLNRLVKAMDVVVVGAGLSGLQAARDIQEAGFTCCVVEATNRVGGKTLSVPSKKSGPGINDIGAAWINDTNQSEMYALFRRFGFDGEVQRATGNSLWQSHDGATIVHPYEQPPVRRILTLFFSEKIFCFSTLTLTRIR